jgi:hypothetical protein
MGFLRNWPPMPENLTQVACFFTGLSDPSAGRDSWLEKTDRHPDYL